MKMPRVRFTVRRTMLAVAILAILTAAVRMLLDNQPPRLWEKWLEEADPSRRESAAQELGRLGRRARGSTQALARAMRSDADPKVRRRSAISLYTILAEHGGEQERRDGVVALAEAQGDPDPSVRAASALGLSVLRAAPGLTIPALLRAAKDRGGDQWGRATAVQEVARQASGEAAGDPAVAEVIIGALVDEDARVRAVATDAFFILSEKSSAVPMMALRDRDVRIRRAAGRALRGNGLRAGSATPSLLSALNDEDEEVRVAASEALSVAIPDRRGRVPPALVAGLKDGNVAVRKAAAKALGDYGSGAKGALAALESAGRDEDESVRRVVVEAILAIRSAIREDDRAIVGHLTEMLKDQDPATRSDAAKELQRIGGDAAPALGELMRVIGEDPDGGVRDSAIRARDAITRASQ